MTMLHGFTRCTWNVSQLTAVLDTRGNLPSRVFSRHQKLLKEPFFNAGVLTEEILF